MKQRLKERRFMHCTKCGQKLVVEKHGDVEVDVCGGCKSLWLDANELETIVESTKRCESLQSFLKILSAGRAR